MVRGDSIKWRAMFAQFGGWNTPRQRRTQEREARLALAWILEQDAQEYRILELGCGNGHVGKIISEGLADSGVAFSYHFTDLLPECVSAAEAAMRVSPVPFSNLAFSTLDVYKASAHLTSGAYNVIVSTGFISAATYKDAVPAVAELLCKGGVLIADFINHFSPAIFFAHPIREAKRMLQYALGTGKSYHLGILGIREYFGRFGLDLARSRVVRFRRNPILCMFRKKQ